MQEQHIANQDHHADEAEGVNVSGTDALDSVQETYEVAATENGELLFGSYDSSAMFASSRDPPVIFERDDQIDLTIPSNDGAHSIPLTSGPRENTNVSTYNVNKAMTTNRDNSENSAESTPMWKLQDCKSVPLLNLHCSAPPLSWKRLVSHHTSCVFDGRTTDTSVLDEIVSIAPEAICSSTQLDSTD